MEDLRIAARILKDRKVAPGVVLKIVPATDEIWNQCLEEGLIKSFKDAGVLIGKPGVPGALPDRSGRMDPEKSHSAPATATLPENRGKAASI